MERLGFKGRNLRHESPFFPLRVHGNYELSPNLLHHGLTQNKYEVRYMKSSTFEVLSLSAFFITD